MIDVAARTEDFIEFCAGAGQLGEGVQLAIESAWAARAAAAPDDDAGGVGRSQSARPVCYVEIDLAPALVLAARIRDGALPDAPIGSNLKSFDPRPWRGLVDGIIGGYPCQPFSAAGKRLGVNDPRHLWPWIIRHIRSVRPRWCFFENVGEHLRIGYHDVVRPDLARAGYRVAEILLKASAIGAPHGRERLFILAVADCAGVLEGEAGHQRTRRQPSGSSREDVADADRRGLGAVAAPPAERSRADDRDAGVAHSGQAERRSRRAGRAGETSGGAHAEPARPGAGLAASGCERPQGERAGGAAPGTTGRGGGANLPLAYGPYGGWPPGPGDAAAWGRILAERPELAPATQSSVRRRTHELAGKLDEPAPDLSRADRLRIIGNGVVPPQVAEAFRMLADELGLEL